MITTELKSHFLRLYQMAFSDDNFHPMELQMLYKFAEERSITRLELDEILLNPASPTVIPENVEERIGYLYDLAVMIWADNQVTDDELNTLKKYCKKFEFLDENIDELANYLLDCAKKKQSRESLINDIKE